MNVAAITITYNDGYKFREWYNHYLEYKDELFLHIIVDNGSDKDYIKLLDDTFIDSKIIKRTTNGGLTIAYNDGLTFALENKEVDAILIIGNDVRIEKGGTTKLYNFLMSRSDFGIVAPVLLAKDSDIIDDFGCYISKFLYLKPQNVGCNVNEVNISERIVDTVTGGMSLSRREFYEQLGFQDENLFMYSDEVDLGLRAKRSAYKIAVTKSLKSWHQHINPGNRKTRLPYVGFLIGRNKLYLAYKHFNFFKVLAVLFYQLAVLIRFFYKYDIKYNSYFLFGIFCGFFKIRKNFRFILEN
jgi:GT2 family glycosyltransferase